MKYVVIALIASAFGIATLQQPAAKQCYDAKAKDDVYLLPPPDELKAISLGYRSALADLMWADVLVTQGIRLEEKRHYDTLVPLLDGINALDPEFRDPYLLADALVTFQSVPTAPEDAREARRILELGVKTHPLDAELWRNLGTFVCFLAPSSILTDPDEQDQWRRDGAAYLERAVELAGNDSSVAWQALGGGNRFERMGEREAAKRFYRKVLATTDDDDLRAKAQQNLDRVLAEEVKNHAVDQREIDEFQDRALKPEMKKLRRRHYAGFPWDTMMIMGPPHDAAACAGEYSRRAECAWTWNGWVDARVRALGVK